MRRLVWVLAVVLVTAVGGSAAPPVVRTPVELWRRGDDVLTQRLGHAVEIELKASPELAMSFGKKPGTLIVYISNHVGWKRWLWWTRVYYRVEFSSADGQPLGSLNGACWAGEFRSAAAEIVKRAVAAARELRKRSERTTGGTIEVAFPVGGEPRYCRQFSVTLASGGQVFHPEISGGRFVVRASLADAACVATGIG